MTRSEKISWRRVGFLSAVMLLSCLGGWGLGDAVRISEKPAEYIGLIFSILAASLFAVVSIVGDPSMIVSGNARSAWQNAQEIQYELHRFIFLFYVYLITLGLLVASELAESACWTNWYWLTNVFTGFSIGGFLLSLALPSDFMSLQKRRLEQEIEARNKGK